MRNAQVKQKTSLGKISSITKETRIASGRLKPTEPSAGGTAKDIGGVTLAPLPSDGQQRSVVNTGRKTRIMFVAVVDSQQVPLMPTKPARARKWIKSGKATPFWKRGVFCVRLNVDPSDRQVQPITIGIDSGSKREAYTVKSKFHTYLNVLTETPHWIKDAVESRRNARRSRRNRNTPCRKNKTNRAIGCLPPSTKARWQLKNRIINWFAKMYPFTDIVVENIAAITKKGKRKWNVGFSPLESGKQWFYDGISKLCRLTTKQGYETKTLRDKYGLIKNKSKLVDKFECHNIDSWVLANAITGGHCKPDNIELIKLVPLQFHRRQLHVFRPARGGVRKDYGGTRSMGFARGSIIKHSKHGVCYTGGSSKNRISLHECSSGRRFTKNAKAEDIKFLSYASWRREF